MSRKTITYTAPKEAAEQYLIEPDIDHDEAWRLLDKTGGWFSAERKLLRVERIDLPVYIFSIDTIDRKGSRVTHEVCADAVEGQFALIQTANLNKNCETLHSEFHHTLNMQTAEKTVRREFRHHIFRLRPGLKLSELQYRAKAWYPYWIGYFETSKGLFYEALDACSGKSQGVKMKSLFNKVLLIKSKNAEISALHETNAI